MTGNRRVTVAGQRRTFTGFAFEPCHPGRRAPSRLDCMHFLSGLSIPWVEKGVKTFAGWTRFHRRLATLAGLLAILFNRREMDSPLLSPQFYCLLAEGSTFAHPPESRALAWSEIWRDPAGKGRRACQR